MTHLFPFAVAVLETGAAIVFAYHGNGRMALLWGGYAVAAWVLAGMR